MQKIIINEALATEIGKGTNALQQKGVKVFTAKTNDEILSIHRTEKANLIISRVDLPGIACEQLFTAIRKDAALRSVSLILFCPERPDDKARAEQCGPNAIMTLPVNSELLLEKAASLLHVTSRKSYRVLLNVSVDGNRDGSFFCRSENISATGLLLETDRGLSRGDRLTCSFFLPDAKRITVKAEVVREIGRADKSKTKLYGIKFDHVSPEDVAAIEAFVKKRSGETR
jgi:DNA-binding response OmpR family regulator